MLEIRFPSALLMRPLKRALSDTLPVSGQCKFPNDFLDTRDFQRICRNNRLDVTDHIQRSQKLYDIISIVPWYQNKLDTQTYLREINKDKKVSDIGNDMILALL